MKIVMNAGLLIAAAVLSCPACKKSSAAASSSNSGGIVATAADSVYAPVDVSTPSSIGFFGNG